jgi:hypothetical protein
MDGYFAIKEFSPSKAKNGENNNKGQKMANFILQMFSEGSQVSSMRVMSMTSLWFGGIVCIFGMYKGVDATQLAVITGVFVTSAFGGKAIQKKYEKDQATLDAVTDLVKNDKTP